MWGSRGGPGALETRGARLGRGITVCERWNHPLVLRGAAIQPSEEDDVQGTVWGGVQRTGRAWTVARWALKKGMEWGDGPDMAERHGRAALGAASESVPESSTATC
jgi:hypothetical protein